MKEHVVLSLKQLAGNSCKVPENVLCPAVIVSPVVVDLFVASKFKLRTQKTILPQWWQKGGARGAGAPATFRFAHCIPTTALEMPNPPYHLSPQLFHLPLSLFHCYQ